ncbi:putative membrane protein YqjE [Pseudoduganella flava]|uniref:Phage holin family protein n=1 Tax=Pseudoduganella flava TaxID=871742 RepID=A0A562PJ20_9BURK|nr:phage holin family protein [Pseudoduganella flava]QGZ42017.1 phage holin family protein [Pseudoduganella flava]TWI44434.1 putative membrane protein YqjE [Pseudoduganella flava]
MEHSEQSAQSDYEQPRPPGLIGSLAGVAKNSLRLVLSRVELAACELSEVRDHIVQLSVLFALSVLAAWFAIAFGTATLVVLAWEALGWKILLILAVVFVVIAIGLVMTISKMIRSGKLALPATMAELKADRDMLL